MRRAISLAVPFIVSLSVSLGFASVPCQKSAPDGTSTPAVMSVDLLVKRIEKSLATLAPLQEDKHWSDARTTAMVVLAYSGEGHTLRRGPYAKPIRDAVQWTSKQVDPKTGLLGYVKEYDDMAHAWALTAIADITQLDRSTTGKVITGRLVMGALSRQGEDGLWGAGDSMVETTAQMLVGLSLVKAAKIEVDDSVMERAFAGLDRLTDAKTGQVTPVKGAGPIATARATSAVILAKLRHAKLPSNDEVLARSLDLMGKQLSEASPHMKLYLKSGDLEFWRWTTLCRVQMGADRAWREAGFQHVEAAVTAGIEGSSDTPAMDLALATQVLGAGYRYERAIK